MRQGKAEAKDLGTPASAGRKRPASAEPRPFFRVWDLFVLLPLLLFSLLWAGRLPVRPLATPLGSQEGRDAAPIRAKAVAIISDAHGQVANLPLKARQEEKVFSLPGHETVQFLLTRDAGIAFLHSDCPDQICIRAGILRDIGTFAACLPNGLVLQVVAAPSSASAQGETESGTVPGADDKPGASGRTDESRNSGTTESNPGIDAYVGTGIWTAGMSAETPVTWGGLFRSPALLLRVRTGEIPMERRAPHA